MIINVMCLGFGEDWEIRPVTIPDLYDAETDTVILEQVFYYGQNDFQPQQHPSVSVGDVAIIPRIGNKPKLYRCDIVGWDELTPAQMVAYLTMPHQERAFNAMAKIKASKKKPTILVINEVEGGVISDTSMTGDYITETLTIDWDCFADGENEENDRRIMKEVAKLPESPTRKRLMERLEEEYNKTWGPEDNT